MLRRHFLAGCAAASPFTGSLRAAAEGWAAVPGILARIRPPEFAAREFSIVRYGAAGDGRTDCRAAFRKAIAACRAAGGGTVMAPAGEYLSNGPIHLESDINLHLAEGAVLRFGTNPADYLPVVPVRWEGTRCANYSPLIYAYRKENIGITGRGAIDGQAARFWHEWKRRQTPAQEAIRAMGAAQTEIGKRVFGEGHFLRPSLFQPFECRNLLVEGVTLQGSPFWTVHPTFCTNVTVRGIRVLPGTTNDDGVDPDSSSDVLIEDCVFDTADDNIAIKAGRDQDAWGGPACENIVVRNCRGIRSRANGYCIGSEMSGGVRNVFIENNQVGDVQTALYIKSNSDRGGTVENVWMRHNTVEACDTFIKLETGYKGVTGHPYPPLYRNFHFSDVKCGKARKTAIYSVGVAARPISAVSLEDVTVESAAEVKRIEHTQGLSLRNVRVNGQVIAT